MIKPHKSWPDFSGSRVLIVTHRSPDMDAIGSCMAMALWLTRIQVPNRIWIPEPLPKIGREIGEVLPNTVSPFPHDFTYDTVVFLDCSHSDRLFDLTPLLPKQHRWINIDHHQDNTLFGDINIVGNWSSVGELLAIQFQTMTEQLPTPIAQWLYAAMISDTGSFRFENTTQLTFETAAFLVRCGVKPASIAQALFDQRTVDDIDVLKAAINTMVVNTELGLTHTAYTCINPLVGNDVTDFMRTVQGTKILVIFRKTDPEWVRINFRSKSGFDVATFAKRFGGGGHKAAAGARIQGELNAVRAEVISQLEAALKG